MLYDNQRCLLSWASFRNIDVIINEKKILKNININLNYGENTVIIGPNGSGKSTFLKLLNRSIYPINSRNSYFKLFNKENINIWDLRRKVGFLFKEMEGRVNSSVNLYDLIASGFSGTFNSRQNNLISKEEYKRIDKLIDDWELNNIKDMPFHSLSDGQRRRALIARAIVYEPNLLVLDEPFCNLDLKSNFILNRNLNSLINKSKNIIYVTHNLESILPKTNRVIFIKEGKIINNGNTNDILKTKNISDLFDMPINVVRQGNYWRSIPLSN
tara:strand:- start:1060 stop:1872 length:813 start_codon:yes stop_codon:yes gene_type:complete